MIKISKIALAFLIFLMLPVVTQAATFSFSPSSGVFGKGENFTVGVYVDTSASINAVQGLVNFPAEYLEVIKIDNNHNSIVDLWVQKPSFSNSGMLGNVRFEGVVLSPGFYGSNGKIIDVTFRVRKEGTADLNFSEFSVLANDGFGTSMAVSTNKASFTLRGEVSPAKNEVVREDIQKIEEKIKAVEHQVKTLTPSSGALSSLIDEKPESLVVIWKKLPLWLKVCVAVFVGIASIILLLVLLGLALVVLLWSWNFVRKHQKEFISSISHSINRNIRRFYWIGRSAREEIGGDISFSVSKVRREFREVIRNDSIVKAVKHYLVIVWKIIKRFLTKNRKF